MQINFCQILLAIFDWRNNTLDVIRVEFVSFLVTKMGQVISTVSACELDFIVVQVGILGLFLKLMEDFLEIWVLSRTG
jgi:hypothetical protein